MGLPPRILQLQLRVHAQAPRKTETPKKDDESSNTKNEPTTQNTKADEERLKKELEELEANTRKYMAQMIQSAWMFGQDNVKSDAKAEDSTTTEPSIQTQDEPQKTPLTANTAPPCDVKSAAASGVFDFSVIPGYNNSLTSFYVQPSQFGNATSKNTIDEGYWDKALDALDQLRPQLHEYIKEELESTNREYNYETVDKFLDKFISSSVSMALAYAGLPLEQTVDNWNKCDQPVGNRSINVKMSNVVDALLQQIDGELGKKSQYTAFGTQVSEHSAPNAFSEVSLNKNNNLNYNYIMETADRYLNPDEIMLKTVLVGLTIPDEVPFGETTTSTIKTVEHILNLYQDQVKTYLKEQYSDLNDEDFNDIFSKATERTLNNADSMRINDKQTGASKYNLEQIIQSFATTCEEIVKSDYPQVIHNEGSLFGITNDNPALNYITTQAREMIKSKIPNVADTVIDQILSTVASYGNTITQDNFDTIIDMLVSQFMIVGPVYDENGREMKVDSMENRLLSAASTFRKDEFGNDLGSLLQSKLTECIDKYLADPNNAYHNEGYLYGIKGGGMFMLQIRAEAEYTIKSKIPGVSTQILNTILSIISSYGNRVKSSDLESILKIIINTGVDLSAKSLNINIRPLIDKYLAEKPEPEKITERQAEKLLGEHKKLLDEYEAAIKEKERKVQEEKDRIKQEMEDLQNIIDDNITSAWNFFAD